VVFFREIRDLSVGVLAFKWNSETKYLAKILISMIPVMAVGFLFKEEVESLFSGNLKLVGAALLVTAALLISTQVVKTGSKKIPFSDAFIMGLAQALAVIPGISRSGATISTGLLLKNDRSEVARFSFLMVLIPIIGAALLDILDMGSSGGTSIGAGPLITGFLAAFLAGYAACSWMIRLVKKGNLYWFAAYCALVGIISIIFS
jgi:undecaprenyl-diphosphatase